VKALRRADVAVDDGRIVAVGKNIEMKGERELDASGRTVMPGFVDPHTHLIFAGSREHELEMKLKGLTYLEILEKGGGIIYTVKQTREATEQELVSQAGRRLISMLRHGTTSAEAKSGYGLDRENELKSLRAIRTLGKNQPVELVPTFLGAHAIPPEFTKRTDGMSTGNGAGGRGGNGNGNGKAFVKKDRDGYIDYLIDEVLPDVVEQGLAEHCDIFCEKGVFDLEQSRRLLGAAAKAGLRPKIHADEIEPLGGSALAAEINAISAEHLVVTPEESMKKMAGAGVVANLLPGTPYVLMSEHFSNARRMMDLGVPVALATDLNPNCWTESMQMIISLACYRMRMTPSEALVSATINAAYAIGRGAEIGSLTPGKQADIIILDVPDHLHIPYRFGVNHVRTVIKKGRVVVEE